MNNEKEIDNLRFTLLLGHSVASQNSDDAECVAREVIEEGYRKADQVRKESIVQFAKEIENAIQHILSIPYEGSEERLPVRKGMESAFMDCIDIIKEHLELCGVEVKNE